MKNRIVTPLIFSVCVFIFSCAGNHDAAPAPAKQDTLSKEAQELIDETIDCLASDFCGMEKEELYKTVKQLDDFVRSKKHISSGDGKEYMKFFSGKDTVLIPAKHPQFSQFLKLRGDSSATDGAVLAQCLQTISDEESEFPDGTPLYYFAKKFRKFSQAGLPDLKSFGNDVFWKATTADMNSDALRTLYYLMWGIQKIKFEGKSSIAWYNAAAHDDVLQLSIDPLPPPPPPEDNAPTLRHINFTTPTIIEADDVVDTTGN